ncbi:BON domain-containing protein [Sulfuriflexus mobilis]|uniref:BON domain-containing protein n=1 Tax=Sulfuriflexus mobilis TaxID=1811807 RepID=UPI000F84D390|nr:BON domain-containing protein [Sulfuriflexus mobilis]
MNKGFGKMTTRLLILSSVIMIMGLSGCAGALVGNTQPGTYQGSNTDRSHAQISTDGAITSSIRSRYRSDSLLSAADIQVSTYRNVVTLYGQVASRRIADRAVGIARGVSGVSRVVSKLSVAP